MKLTQDFFLILLFSIFFFVVEASPSTDDEAKMLEEMMDQLSQDASPARHVRSKRQSPDRQEERAVYGPNWRATIAATSRRPHDTRFRPRMYISKIRRGF